MHGALPGKVVSRRGRRAAADLQGKRLAKVEGAPSASFKGAEVDGRYINAAFALVTVAGLVSTWRGSYTAFAWSVPFALILVFLAAAGKSPAGRVVHLTSDEPLR